jgi:hypothetical protein
MSLSVLGCCIHIHEHISYLLVAANVPMQSSLSADILLINTAVYSGILIYNTTTNIRQYKPTRLLDNNAVGGVWVKSISGLFHCDDG